MLEKPDIPDEEIIACARADYGLSIAQVAFLPLGADPNTAVYRVVAEDETPYFLKLRRGAFEETSVELPKFLSDQGITQIIAPLKTQAGQLRSRLGAFAVVLYPFVEGRDGYEVSLSDGHYRQLGQALRRLHSLRVPPVLLASIQRETYPPRWRESVKAFLARVEAHTWADPVAKETAALLRARRGQILDLVGRADRLAQALKAGPPEEVVCHSDLHAGNMLITASGALYIIDWDDPILAPKERDLMFIGGGLLGNWRTSLEEADLFYPGYGQTQINLGALAFYRYERIIEDIAVFCEQLLGTAEGGAIGHNPSATWPPISCPTTRFR
jgi:spectinomycin phosphotransferase